MRTEDPAGFLAEDYTFTAALLRKYTEGPSSNQRTSLFRAVCSKNLNIILAALDHAARCEEIAP
jgi:hypothetical protein